MYKLLSHLISQMFMSEMEEKMEKGYTLYNTKLHVYKVVVSRIRNGFRIKQ